MTRSTFRAWKCRLGVHRLLYEIVIDCCASLIVLGLMVIGFIETVHWLHG